MSSELITYELKKTCTYANYNIFAPIFCNNISERINGFCFQHQQYIDEFEEYLDKERAYVIHVCVNLFEDIKKTFSKYEKCFFCEQLFNFLIFHPKFLIKNKNFYNTTMIKLNELKISIEEDKQYKIIFDPEKYIDILSGLIIMQNNNLQNIENENIFYINI
jgi:hypothetical protein